MKYLLLPLLLVLAACHTTAGGNSPLASPQLLELSGDERFDLVVLDTPPTRHALDFLEAPERMMGFLDTSVLRWFLKPYFVAGRLTLKVATRTGKVALGLVDRYLGLQFLQDLIWKEEVLGVVCVDTYLSPSRFEGSTDAAPA